jgi:hypothetical protein
MKGMKRIAALALVLSLAFATIAYGAQGNMVFSGHPGLLAGAGIHTDGAGIHADGDVPIEKADIHFDKLTAKNKYWASRASYAFHRTGCRYIKQIKSSNLIGFKTRSAAIKAGKTPCKVCRP